jgi:hypothetical protein
MATVVVVKLLVINNINITSNSRGINAAADPTLFSLNGKHVSIKT